MDNFIFVPQSGYRKKSSKSRELVRAHVARKYWQEVKGRNPNKILEGSIIPTDSSSDSSDDAYNTPQSPFISPSKPGKKIAKTNEVKTISKKHQFPMKLCQSIGHGSDELVYAGSSLDADSYEFFQHYGSEFKVVLCDSIQPVRTDGPAVCCTKAVQMHSPALLHAICFQASAHVAVRQAGLPLRKDIFKDPNHAFGLEQKALYHRSKALSNLRQILSTQDAVTPATAETSILCVALLLAAEAIMGDDVGLRSHANGLGQLVEASGGIHKLGSSTARLVRFADVKAALAQQRVPFYESKSSLRTKAQFSTPLYFLPVAASDELDMFGSGFFRPLLFSRLCPPLRLLISQVRDLTLDSLKASKCPRTIASYGIDDFIAVESSLLSIKKHHELSVPEEGVRVALLLFINTALWRTPPFFKWVQRHLSELKTILLLLDLKIAITDCTDLFLWIVFLGRYVARTGTFKERCWWSGRLHELASQAGLTTFQEARQVLRTFAYVDEVYALAWEQIWNDVQDCGTRHDGAYRSDCSEEEHPCDYCHH